MSYVLPQVLVFQDFQLSPAAVANPLRAHISGPHAQLIRFSDAGEKPLGLLGFYDRLVDTGYLWPSRATGGKVDAGYVKLWAENAILKYFEDTVGGGSLIKKKSGYNNRIVSDSVNFKTNGDFGRAAGLYDRDVAVGDVVKARFVPTGEDPVTVWSTVSGFVAEAVASVIEAATADSYNPATSGSASATATQIQGPFNGLTASASAAAYSPYPTGQVEETYTIIVTQSSSGGDLTTARLRVISASGLDDANDVVPAANGSPTDIGANGLTVTFTDSDTSDWSDSASAQGVSSEDLLAGQRWTVEATALYTAETAAANAGSGTYTGTQATTYIVEVVRGGKFADSVKPQISVTTTTGVDISGPTTVSAAGVARPIGTKGVTLTFTGTGLVFRNRWYIEVTPQTEGALRTLVLSNNIPSDIPADTPCDLTLYIRKPTLQIAQNREGFAPETNFEISETEITVNDGIQVYDETWTDDGVPLPLPLESSSTNGYGKLFVEYRAWLPTLAAAVHGISDVGDIDDISGALHPDNPLKWGVFKALANANGVEVKYTSVADPDDDDSWVNVLDLLLGRDDVYGLVPLTRSRTVLDLYAAHAASQSSPEQGLWRVLWVSLAGIPQIPVVSTGSTVPGYLEATTSDGETALAVIEDDGETSGTQYTTLRVPADNAKFSTNGVRPGDIVRTLYTGDGFGNYTYSEFVVDVVQTENQLRLVSGPDTPISVPSKIEIWRNLTATEEAAAIAADAGSWGNRRVRAVWPDQIESSGTIQDGFHLCAALAGLRSGVLPHQGLTNVEILGFSDVQRTVGKFNRSQLDTMAGSGVWLVTQDRFSGKVFTRHAMTTADYDDINQREEMICGNVDSISYRFKDYFAPFIGVSNVTPSLIDLLELEVGKLVATLQTERASRTLGGQIITAEIVELAQHPTLKDRVVLKLNTTVPAPFNSFEISLLIT